MNAFASIFSAISQLFAMITSLFATADRGVSMLDKVVTTAAAQQRIRVSIDMHDYRARTEEESAMRITERRQRINAFCADPERAGIYRQALAEIRAAVTASEELEAKKRS